MSGRLLHSKGQSVASLTVARSRLLLVSRPFGERLRTGLTQRQSICDLCEELYLERSVSSLGHAGGRPGSLQHVRRGMPLSHRWTTYFLAKYRVSRSYRLPGTSQDRHSNRFHRPSSRNPSCALCWLTSPRTVRSSFVTRAARRSRSASWQVSEPALLWLLAGFLRLYSTRRRACSDRRTARSSTYPTCSQLFAAVCEGRSFSSAPRGRRWVQYTRRYQPIMGSLRGGLLLFVPKGAGSTLPGGRRKG